MTAISEPLCWCRLEITQTTLPLFSMAVTLIRDDIFKIVGYASDVNQFHSCHQHVFDNERTCDEFNDICERTAGEAVDYSLKFVSFID